VSGTSLERAKATFVGESDGVGDEVAVGDVDGDAEPLGVALAEGDLEGLGELLGDDFDIGRRTPLSQTNFPFTRMQVNFLPR